MIKTSEMGKFFFDAFQVDWRSMKKNVFIDVSSKNVKIKAWDPQKQQESFQKVLKIIRKKDSTEYVVVNNSTSLSCSERHLIAIKFDLENPTFTYVAVGDLYTFQKKNICYSFNGTSWEKTEILKKSNKIPILDLEVEGTSNYFSDSILSHNSYGSPVTTPGGKALKFFASVRLEVARIDTLMKGEDPIGSKVRIKAAKNKVAPPFKKVEIDLFYDSGFSKESALIESAVDLGLFKKSGSWFSYNDNKIGQGKENVRQYLLDEPSFYDRIEKEITEVLKNQRQEKEQLDLSRRRKREENAIVQSLEGPTEKAEPETPPEESNLPIATMAEEPKGE